jgi:5-(carboxyamino)imidazole ribonucleotide synthase
MSGQILPGATLGVLGGGQLGRMFCVAARTMGYRVVVLDPDPLCGAGMIADVHIKADYDDQTALAEMASQCDVITLEFENIPSESVRFIADKTTVFPVAESLEIAQNRDLEKQFALKAGLHPVPYFAIMQQDDLQQAADEVGFPAILKSNTLGYDGKGQFVVNDFSELCAAYDQVGKVDCVLEKKVNIQCEVSAIVARNANAELASFPVSENQHRNGVLHMSIVPARVENRITQQAIEGASTLADAMSYVGILAVEFFVSDEGVLYFTIAVITPKMLALPHSLNSRCA